MQPLTRGYSFVPSVLKDRARPFGPGDSLIAGKTVPLPLLIRFGQRYSQGSGSDVPDTWTRRGQA